MSRQFHDLADFFIYQSIHLREKIEAEELLNRLRQETRLAATVKEIVIEYSKYKRAENFRNVVELLAQMLPLFQGLMDFRWNCRQEITHAIMSGLSYNCLRRRLHISRWPNRYRWIGTSLKPPSLRNSLNLFSLDVALDSNSSLERNQRMMSDMAEIIFTCPNLKILK